jgi:broad specificity phosphatase PhoE
MKLVLICCPDIALSESPQENDSQRRTKRQADTIAREVIDRFELAAVYASPDPAALETATAIGNDFGLIAATAGDLEATTTDLEAFAAPEVSARREGGEQVENLEARAWRQVEQIRDETDAAATVAIVSNSLAIRAVVCRLLGVPLSGSHRFEIAAASLSTIDFRPNRTILAGLNETCHLEGSG